MKVVLLNDTRIDPNPGCQATVTALTRRLAAGVGGNLLCTPRGWGGRHFAPLASESRRRSRDAWRACVDSLQSDRTITDVLGRADLVVANLEGTFHHHTTGALALGGTIALAHRLGIPVWAVNGTVEALEPWLLDETLRPASYVAVREPLSAAWLAGQGIAAVQASDCAFLMQPLTGSPGRPRIQSIPARPRALYTPGILASLDHPARVSSDDVVAHLRLLSGRGFDPVYLQMSESESAISDLVRAQGWQVADAAHIAWHAYGRYLQQFDLVVSGRYHVLIFAAMSRTPFIPLPSNSWKIPGLLALVGAAGDVCSDTRSLERALDEATPGHRVDPCVLSTCRRLGSLNLPVQETPPSLEGLDLLPDEDLDAALDSIQRDRIATFATTIDLAPAFEACRHISLRPRSAWSLRLAAHGFEIASERLHDVESSDAALPSPDLDTWIRTNPFREGNPAARWSLILRKATSPGAANTIVRGSTADVRVPPEILDGRVHLVFVVADDRDIGELRPVWRCLPRRAFTIVALCGEDVTLSRLDLWDGSDPWPVIRLGPGEQIPWTRYEDGRAVLITCAAAPDHPSARALALVLAARRHRWRTVWLRPAGASSGSETLDGFADLTVGASYPGSPHGTRRSPFRPTGYPRFDACATRGRHLRDLLGSWVDDYSETAWVPSFRDDGIGAESLLAAAGGRPRTLFLVHAALPRDGSPVTRSSNVQFIEDACVWRMGVDATDLMAACDAVLCRTKEDALEAVLAHKPSFWLRDLSPVSAQELTGAANSMADSSLPPGSSIELLLKACVEELPGTSPVSTPGLEGITWLADMLHRETAAERAAAARDRRTIDALRQERYWLDRLQAEKTAAWLRGLHAPLRVALFGASSLGEQWAQRLAASECLHLSFYIDNDPAKWGKRLRGLPIVEPSPDAYDMVDAIAITSIHVPALVSQVTDAGAGHKLVVDPSLLLTAPRS